MAAPKFSLVGASDVVRKFKAVRRELAGKAGREALLKGARLVAGQARENALKVDDPETRRRIRDNIIIQFASKIYNRSGDIMYRIGVNTARGPIPSGNPDTGTGGSTPHWHLIELGHEHAPANPFMRQSLSQNINPVIDIVINELNAALTRITN